MTEENLEVRFKINSSREPELFGILKEMVDFFSPLKARDLTRMLIKKAYENWFQTEIKKKETKY